MVRLAAPTPLPDELQAELRAHKAEIVAALGVQAPEDPEVLRRAEMFRDHLSTPGHSKFFVMPRVEPAENTCQTCGEEPPTGRLGVRCQICATAARLALQQLQSAPKQVEPKGRMK